MRRPQTPWNPLFRNSRGFVFFGVGFGGVCFFVQLFCKECARVFKGGLQFLFFVFLVFRYSIILYYGFKVVCFICLFYFFLVLDVVYSCFSSLFSDKNTHTYNIYIYIYSSFDLNKTDSH